MILVMCWAEQHSQSIQITLLIALGRLQGGDASGPIEIKSLASHTNL